MAVNPRRKSDAARRANQVIRSRTVAVVLLLGVSTGFWVYLGWFLQVAPGVLTVISGVDYIVKNLQVLKD